MRIAVVGTGIAGLVAAHRLAGAHELVIYEADARVGGHTNTVELATERGRLAVDTGFIVFNERTYPRFCSLLRELGVAWQPSDMSFSVSSAANGLEYNATSLAGLLARPTNALRPSFWRMLRDILRFYREAPALLEQPDEDIGLGAYLARHGYSRAFVDQHLVPMAAAVWSARPDRLLEFPARFLVRFFANHGFLQVEDRPQWLVVRGGSQEYVRALIAPFAERIRLRTPVVGLRRTPRGVLLRTRDGAEELYESVVLATHADTSLAILSDATPLEREILSAFEYQRNEAVLHSDPSLMPRRRRAWASWNYHLVDPPSELPTVTYWMNRLQGLSDPKPYLVTLNRSASIDPARVHRRFVYHHPVYSPAALRAQRRHAEIDGLHGVHYCGAYWGYGFHEDGVASACTVVERVLEGVRA